MRHYWIIVSSYPLRCHQKPLLLFQRTDGSFHIMLFQHKLSQRGLYWSKATHACMRKNNSSEINRKAFSPDLCIQTSAGFISVASACFLVQNTKSSLCLTGTMHLQILDFMTLSWDASVRLLNYSQRAFQGKSKGQLFQHPRSKSYLFERGNPGINQQQKQTWTVP